MYAKILVALDGSDYSLAGGEIALSLAQSLGSELLAVHIYDAGLHRHRFQEMEPVLPSRYQEESKISHLRDSHQELISQGFEALSWGYMDRYLNQAREAGLSINPLHRQGRNYLELLRIAREQQVDLIVLGAHGLGKVPEGLLGSTALRILRLATCDVLIARPDHDGGTVMVGIDGSEEALVAARKAITWTRILNKSLRLAAVYDPHFHTQVFKTMAGALSQERQAEVGLNKQESLHDQLIDDGLAKLYVNFLDQASERCREMKLAAETRLLQGKGYYALVEEARSEAVDLLVVGRYGHHREDLARIGSNSEAVARLAPGSVLITAASVKGSLSSGVPGAEIAGRDQVASRDPGAGTTDKTRGTQPLEWEEDALARLQGIPPFARPMAKAGIEQFVRAKGGSRVGLADVQEVAQRFGMGGDSKPLGSNHG